MDEVLVRTARELAPELDRLIDEFSHGIGNIDLGNNGTELRQFLWDNKIGILRVLQAVAEF